MKFRVAVVSQSQVRVEILLKMQEGNQLLDLSEVILALQRIRNCSLLFVGKFCIYDLKTRREQVHCAGKQ